MDNSETKFDRLLAAMANGEPHKADTTAASRTLAPNKAEKEGRKKKKEP